MSALPPLPHLFSREGCLFAVEPAVPGDVGRGGGESETRTGFFHDLPDPEEDVLLDGQEFRPLFRPDIGEDQDIQGRGSVGLEPGEGNRVGRHFRVGVEHIPDGRQDPPELVSGGLVPEAEGFLHQRTVSPGDVHDLHLGELRVGDGDHRPVEGLDLRGAESDVEDRARRVAEPAVFSDLHGPVGEKGESSDDVLHRGLGGQGDGQSHHAQSGEEMEDGQPQPGETVEKDPRSRGDADEPAHGPDEAGVDALRFHPGRQDDQLGDSLSHPDGAPRPAEPADCGEELDEKDAQPAGDVDGVVHEQNCLGRGQGECHRGKDPEDIPREEAHVPGDFSEQSPDADVQGNEHQQDQGQGDPLPERLFMDFGGGPPGKDFRPLGREKPARRDDVVVIGPFHRSGQVGHVLNSAVVVLKAGKGGRGEEPFPFRLAGFDPVQLKFRAGDVPSGDSGVSGIDPVLSAGNGPERRKADAVKDFLEKQRPFPGDVIPEDVRYFREVQALHGPLEVVPGQISFFHRFGGVDEEAGSAPGDHPGLLQVVVPRVHVGDKGCEGVPGRRPVGWGQGIRG
ncbi:hypothetical protein SDC9_42848 [bioreactor metagenome]|uniref:Uncharacterized protein n=1 Tax=bioreactor metagenome TaxID=1076179 RepID=A0A644VZB2_9ZZZZ